MADMADAGILKSKETSLKDGKRGDSRRVRPDGLGLLLVE